MKKQFNAADPAPSSGPKVVIDFAKAPAALKDQMEKVMNAIDRVPDNFDAVATFGQAPADKLLRILDDLHKIHDKLRDGGGEKEIIEEAGKLGLARVDATRELAIYIGASSEVLRRYDQEYIREANKNFRESNDPEDREYLDNVLKRKADFVERAAALEHLRYDSIVTAQQLRQVIEMAEYKLRAPQPPAPGSSATSDASRGKKLPGKPKRSF
jgi:hypothetical protein